MASIPWVAAPVEVDLAVVYQCDTAYCLAYGRMAGRGGFLADGDRGSQMTYELWKGFAVLLFCFWCIPASYFVWATLGPRNPLRHRVFSNLDSALAGGHFADGGYLDGMTADELAYDMTVYAADLEDHDPAQLSGFVREWLAMAGLA